MDLLIEPDCFKICRLCMENCGKEYIPIYNEFDGKSLVSIIIECAQIEIFEDDMLPKNSCRKCAESMNVAFNIIQRCRKSDVALRSILKTDLNQRPDNLNNLTEETFSEVNVDGGKETTYINHLIEYDNSADEDFQQNQSEPDEEICVGSKDKKRGPKRAKTLKRCCGCKKEFSDEKSLLTHSQNIHSSNKMYEDSKKQFECHICFKRYALKRTLRRHQQEMFVEKPFKCVGVGCGDSFITENQLNEHEKSHMVVEAAQETPLFPRCCSCLTDFESEEALKDHSVLVHFPERIDGHESQRYECDICFRRYKTKYNLSEHKLKAYRDKKYQCIQCGRTFRDNTILADHERTHTNERPFECQICNKNFAIKDSFRKHVKSHGMASDQFKCSICGRGFRTKGNLKGHYLVHATDRPLECPLCTSTFARKICLKLHMRTHTGEKPHACSMCDKRYAHASDLKRHIMSHTGVKPFLCTFCGRRFPRKDYLAKHMAMHKSSDYDQQSVISTFKVEYS